MLAIARPLLVYGLLELVPCLVARLQQVGGRLAIISAEGGVFDIIAGRYTNNVPNMDLWLKGHSGAVEQ
jgi:hypothetical protein